MRPLPFPTPVAPLYKPRWLNQQQSYDIVDLYHLARTAGKENRYERKLWTAQQFHLANPSISQSAAYKDLDGLLTQ